VGDVGLSCENRRGGRGRRAVGKTWLHRTRKEGKVNLSSGNSSPRGDKKLVGMSSSQAFRGYKQRGRERPGRSNGSPKITNRKVRAGGFWGVVETLAAKRKITLGSAPYS